ETIIDEEQIHLNYFDNIGGHIKNLGDAYLARIAGTSSATGLEPADLPFPVTRHNKKEKMTRFIKGELICQRRPDTCKHFICQ
ncbi:MAG: hypothetical protein AB7U36_13525, partial [Desulfobacter sp.]